MSTDPTPQNPTPLTVVAPKHPRKRLVLILGALSAFGATAAFASKAISSRHRQRVDAALTSSSPCSVKGLAQEDLSWLRDNDTWHSPSGTDESRSSMYESRLKRCENERERADVEQACTQLAAALDNQAPPTTKKFSPSDLDLLRRITSRTLVADDLKRFESLPCKDTASAGRIQSAFVVAASEVGLGWLSAGVPTELKTVAARHGVSSGATEALRAKSEAQAEAALRSGGDLDSLNGAVAACDIVKDLTRDDGAKCKLARERRTAVVAKEEAAQRAKDARCTALKLAQDQCTQRCESREPKDDLGFADFEKGLDCGDRCEKLVPLKGCD